MKKQVIIISILFLFALVLTSCDPDLENKFTFKNYSAGKVLINFRGSLYEVNQGVSFTINDVPKGTYSYTTTYEVPVGTETTSSEGNVEGSVIFKASTRILVVFSSTFNDGAYTIYATISSSDDQADDSESVTEP